jgi:hypothetical protein
MGGEGHGLDGAVVVAIRCIEHSTVLGKVLHQKAHIEGTSAEQVAMAGEAASGGRLRSSSSRLRISAAAAAGGYDWVTRNTCSHGRAGAGSHVKRSTSSSR